MHDTAPLPARSRFGRWLGLAAFLPLLAVLGWQIATSWFVCDDAFIAFRYARHLADGHGLVFNRGERVEGFTDFLWVLELAGLWRLGVRPELAAPLLSLALTAGTLALVMANAARVAAAGQRRPAAWIACGLVAGSASFAVWSTSGLETRQFTFFTVLAVTLASRADATAGRLLAASLGFAAAEYTRPEGLLLFGITFAWRLLQDRAAGTRRPWHLACLLLPFALLVAGHFLWRHSYFGEWLPNAYYAKHVRPWYEAGADYVAAAAIELGAWLWLPLGLVTATRAAGPRDLGPGLPFALIAAHVLYLLRIGGDHFEFRPMDFYLPLVAPWAALGVLQLAAMLAGLWRRAEAPRAEWSQRLAVLLAGVTFLYCHAIGATSLATKIPAVVSFDDPGAALRVDLANAPPLRHVPGLRPLCDMLNAIRRRLYAHTVAVPVQVHQQLAQSLRDRFAAAEQLPDGVFPPDAVAAAVSVGVLPFYLRELTFIDVHGLTDATVARTPVAPGTARRMAHDRVAPRSYLRRRGVNVDVEPVAADETAALATADFALRIDAGHWLPLHAANREHAQRMFPAAKLVARHRVDSTTATGNHLRLGGQAFDGVRLLATFEPGAAGLSWSTTGDAAERPARLQVWGGIGDRQLSTEPTDEGTSGSGTARSSTFVAERGDQLVLFLAGERQPGTSARLCRGEQVVATFVPNADGHMHAQACALDRWAGEPLHLELHDRGAGWIAIDHVLLARASATADGAVSTVWTPAPSPVAALIEVTPVPVQPTGDRSGRITITVQNPLPCPLRLDLRFDGPAAAELLPGSWRRIDDDVAIDAVPAGGKARAHAWLQMPAGFEPRREPVFLLLRCTPLLPNGLGAGAPVDVELPVSWQ